MGTLVDSIHTAANGVRIAGSGTVGWDWHTTEQPDGVFFRYRIAAADFAAALPSASR